ncbi:MAG: acyltransferase [Methanosarcinaceae archaeon]
MRRIQRFYFKSLEGLRLLVKEVKAIVKHLIINLPGPLGMEIREKYYKKRFHYASDSFTILPNVTITFPKNFSIGECSGVNVNTWINAMGGVTIGNDVIIGPFVIIHSANHKFDRLDIPIQKQGCEKLSVNIEDDVWIGANAIILPGVTIGRGSVIGAGAVITRDIPPYSVAAGVPAKVIRNRKDKREI